MPEAVASAALDERAADVATGTRPWAVYLLHCAGGKCYIGISPSPQERFDAHRAGKGAAFTRANRPLQLAAVVWFESRSAAASMEARLKTLPRPPKLEWFEGFPVTSESRPAMLEGGLASLSPRIGRWT